MARKNSLVANINRRKRKGTSRSKSRSTVSPDAYREMQRGWPRKKRKKTATAKKSTKKSTRKRSGATRKKKA